MENNGKYCFFVDIFGYINLIKDCQGKIKAIKEMSNLSFHIFSVNLIVFVKNAK